MKNDREKVQQQGTPSTEDQDQERTEQFNELSELSLEERMNVADQIGIPVNNVEDAVATGAMRDNDADENINEDTEKTRGEGSNH